MGEQVSLDGDTARRLKRVLRLRAGDRLVLFDGKGLEADGVLVEGERSASIEGRREVSEAGPEIHLYPALIRANRFDWVIEKAVELGVRSIHPVVCERSIVDERGDRRERWRRIAIEAAEQSNRRLLPEVDSPQRLESALAGARGKLVVAWEGEKSRTLEHATRDENEVSLFTGPEGGYSEREVVTAGDAGAEVVTLGLYTLRAETAAIVALGALMVLAGTASERLPH